MNSRMKGFLLSGVFLFFQFGVSANASFFAQFLEKSKIVGAVAPSSRFLGKKMLGGIDFKKDLVLVEYGPGTGVFTDKIIQKMSDKSVLYIFELNEEFYMQLSVRIKDPRVKIFHDSAESVKKSLIDDDIEHVDYVVSGLPLAVIPLSVKKNILKKSKEILGTHGRYIQFQYSLNDKRLLRKYFSKLRVDFTVLNLPPAFVYTCGNKAN